MDVHLTMGHSGAGLSPLASVAFGAILAAVLGFASTNIISYLKRRDEIRAARSTVYAQLHRVSELVFGQFNYASSLDVPPYIWIPVFAESTPSAPVLNQIQNLTALEVYEIASFLYSYREEMGYILGNARTEERRDEAGKTVSPAELVYLPPGTNPQAATVGYDLSNPYRREWLCNSFKNIYIRATRARRLLGANIKKSWAGDPTLSEKVDEHLARDKEREPHPINQR